MVSSDASPLLPAFCEAAVQLRCGDFHRAEVLLLAAPCPMSADALALLAHLRLLQGHIATAAQLLTALQMRLPRPPAFVRYIQAQLWLQTHQLQHFQSLDPGFWHGEAQEPLLALSHAALALHVGDQGLLAELLKLPVVQDCPEQQRLQARLLKAGGNPNAALALLQQAAERAPQLLGLQRHYIDDLIDAKRYPDALAHLRCVLERHGEHVALMAQVATIKLLQRQPGLARRAALLHRLKCSGVWEQNPITNQLITYEQTGHSDWLAHLIPPLLGDQADPNLLANLVMQLASAGSPMAQVIAQRFCDVMAQRNQTLGILPMPRDAFHRPESPSARLRVVWLSGDLCDHPVGRFLLGFFAAAAQNLTHHHIFVSWSEGKDNPFHGYFSSLIATNFVNAEGLAAAELVQRIRGLHADVVVDLSGWTAKNFGNGLLARLAPVQVNYLGYFASTGNPAIDFWLGDSHLFPEPMHEWHSEQVFRMPRCFIAWQPPKQLIEADLPVPPPPSGPIRYGSFNHNRKFSDRVLKLWGTLLDTVADASLVLKATAPGDDATLALLMRRMERCGLDPSRVIWLPLVPDSKDHLLQYGQMDVALDCLPNGGCTTTCEALWMGVPVVTLCGDSYVSRMSTAVLRGAGLADWCANAESEYVSIAAAQVHRLAELRSQRGHWRQKVQRSELGDAAGLMSHLEQAFSAMVRQHMGHY